METHGLGKFKQNTNIDPTLYQGFQYHSIKILSKKDWWI